MKKVLIIDEDEMLLLRTFLSNQRDLVIHKIRLYECLNKNGEYKSSLEGYKKLRLRIEKLMSKMIVKSVLNFKL